jgi:hypothetical protein
MAEPELADATGYILREYSPETDENFLFRTFIDALRAASPVYRAVHDHLFFDNFRKVIRLILARGAQVIVAAEQDSPVLFGYVVFERRPVDDKDGVLHWAYVKINWRRMGIATQLIGATGIDPNKAYYTTRTSYELAIPVRRLQHSERADWAAERQERMRLAKELEAKGLGEGDTRTLVKKWPGLTFNPFLLPAPELQQKGMTNG